jgi:hypothetical protein
MMNSVGTVRTCEAKGVNATHVAVATAAGTETAPGTKIGVLAIQVVIAGVAGTATVAVTVGVGTTQDATAADALIPLLGVGVGTVQTAIAGDARIFRFSVGVGITHVAIAVGPGTT